MRLYVDTSVLAAYYLPEPLSERADRALGQTTRAVVSELAEVELASAVARKVRMGELEPTDAERVHAQFARHLEARLFDRVALGREEYRLAREWIVRGVSALRTLDALHLATAALLDAPILTADRGLAAAARAFALETWLLTPAPEGGTVHEPRFRYSE